MASDWSNDYWHAMDKQLLKDYAPNDLSEFSPSQFGMPAAPFKPQHQELKGKIFAGVGHVEFGFTGMGKGQSKENNSTPEMYGKEERKILKAMADLNEVTTSTHASLGINGLSGLNMQQQTFSDEQRQQALNELRRAVDFAAEATTGGAIVFHTGEAPTSIRTKFGPQNNGKNKPGFEQFMGEKDEGYLFLADEKEKKLLTLPRDAEVVILEDKKEMDKVTGKPVKKERVINFSDWYKEYKKKNNIKKDNFDIVQKASKRFYNNIIDAQKNQYESSLTIHNRYKDTGDVANVLKKMLNSGNEKNFRKVQEENPHEAARIGIKNFSHIKENRKSIEREYEEKKKEYQFEKDAYDRAQGEIDKLEKKKGDIRVAETFACQ